MHLGNARTALLAWLQIRAQNGKLLLRIEDVDKTRARDFAYESLRRDLSWLGLDWDAEYVQSERDAIYQEHLMKLATYACSCSRKDIQAAASAPHGAEAVYPALCRNGPQDPGRPLALRWRSPDETVTVHDMLLGELSANIQAHFGDIVLRRNDGCWAYHLAVVVDDGLMGVTHVLRLQQALGYPRPQYLHAPLMRDFRGERLAKRQGAPSVHALREAGERPQRILAELARSLDWQVDDEVSAHELLTHFGPQVAAGRLTPQGSPF